MVLYSIIKKSQLEGAHRLDAEYYQPEYLESQNALSRLLTKKLSEVCKISDGNHLTISDSFIDEGVRYLRGKDLNDFFISDNDPVYVPDLIYSKLKRSHIFKNDVLVSIVGTVGMISIVADNFDKLTGSCKIAILRSKEVDPWFLSGFLLSKFGQHQIQRKTAGAVQMGIILKDICDLLVPTINPKEQNKVAEIVHYAYRQQINSEQFYSQAEQLLLEELGLQDFSVEGGLWSVVKLSEVTNTERIDAEYFESKYQKLFKAIKKRNPQTLGGLASIKKGIEPGSEAYTEEGKPFIRVSSISKEGIGDRAQKFLSEEMYQKLKKDFEPKVGEVLLTKDGSVGMACVVREQIAGIISGGILRLKIKDDIDADYLALCLNSIVGQYQAERDAGGSIIKHWKPSEIKKVMIPILPKPSQQKIADLVRQSHEARKKAKELLEEAKRTVERLIEEGEK